MRTLVAGLHNPAHLFSIYNFIFVKKCFNEVSFCQKIKYPKL